MIKSKPASIETDASEVDRGWHPQSKHSSWGILPQESVPKLFDKVGAESPLADKDKMTGLPKDVLGITKDPQWATASLTIKWWHWKSWQTITLQRRMVDPWTMKPSLQKANLLTLQTCKTSLTSQSNSVILCVATLAKGHQSSNPLWTSHWQMKPSWETHRRREVVLQPIFCSKVPAEHGLDGHALAKGHGHTKKNGARCGKRTDGFLDALKDSEPATKAWMEPTDECHNESHHSETASFDWGKS